MQCATQQHMLISKMHEAGLESKSSRWQGKRPDATEIMDSVSTFRPCCKSASTSQEGNSSNFRSRYVLAACAWSADVNVYFLQTTSMNPSANPSFFATLSDKHLRASHLHTATAKPLTTAGTKQSAIAGTSIALTCDRAPMAMAL